MKCPSYNLFFETIASSIRMGILCVLRDGPKSVGDICTAMGEEQSKISHNLKRMADCHILEVEQKGKQRIYSLNKETVIPILELVEKHVKKHCKGACHMEK